MGLVRKIHHLQTLRAIAASLVVADHALEYSIRRQMLGEHCFALAWALGWIGVAVFFVISGFLITSISLKEEASTGSFSATNFYLRRVFRILPAFAVYLGAAALLAAIGAISSPEVAETACRDYLVHDLSQLRRARQGDQLEDDHMRATHLIVEWLRRNGGGVEQVSRDGKTYLRLADLAALRRGVARLLAEVQRIKGEGDGRAARDLVEQYAIRFDERLRDEVCARADHAGIVSYVAYVMPELTPVRDAAGEVVDARVTTPSDFALQMLRFSGKLALEPANAR
jgi:hypothetical protein